LTETEGSLAAQVQPSPRLSRRAFLRSALAAGLAAATGTCGVAYTLALEPAWLAIERVRIRIPGLPPALDGLRVAQLSDLHWGPYTGQKEVQAAVNAAGSLAHHLVVLTGDFVLGSAEYAGPCTHELTALSAPLGVYAVPGNHDYWTDIREVADRLDAAGIPLLCNASLRLEVSGTPLWLTGVDDVWERHDDLETALSGVPRDEPVLLLVHEPDFAEVSARSSHLILLQLSGHSHGGQVNIPFLGPPMLPHLAEIYPAGLQKVPGSKLQVYTNRGIGVIAPPIRLNCRPEVTLLTLTGA
jgi:predicted MPP superfamily phosphohydrolase